jgi:cell division protein FtsB
MTGPISWEQVIGLIGLLAVIAGAFYAAWAKIEARFLLVDTRASNAAESVMKLELKLAREYATISHLQQSEERLVRAIAKLEHTVEQLPGRLAELLHGKRD